MLHFHEKNNMCYVNFGITHFIISKVQITRPPCLVHYWYKIYPYILYWSRGLSSGHLFVLIMRPSVIKLKWKYFRFLISKRTASHF